MLEEINYSENSSNGCTSQKITPKENKGKWHEGKLHGEFKKIGPPSFDGESEEGAKAWLLDMSKYFPIYNYSRNVRARLLVFQLNGKPTIWWQETKTINQIKSSEIN